MGGSRPRRAWLAIPLVIAVTALNAFAGQAWEVEVHGGALISTNPTQGTTAVPPSNPAIPYLPAQPALTTVPVSSWFFGDGTTLINGAVPRQLGVSIVSLQPVFEGRLVERQSGGSFGVRVDRAISPRFSAEFSIDRATGHLAIQSPDLDRIKASEASFLSTWQNFLDLVARNGNTVSSDATVVDNRGAQLITSGALLINLFSNNTLAPYVALGAGYINVRDDGPSAALVGDYAFGFPVAPPLVSVLQINETDAVTIRSLPKNSVTWIAGGGLKYALSERWGVRVDVRDHINRDVIRTTVTARPTAASSGANGVLALSFATGQTLVFAAGQGLRSTLSATLDNFRTFTGSGVVNQVNTSAGVYWRF